MKEAQVARGADFAGGGVIRRLRKMATLVIPLILCTFRRADELALAMEGRGYHRGPRTYLRELKFTRVDYAALSCRHSLPGRGRGASFPAPLSSGLCEHPCPTAGRPFSLRNRLFLHLWLQFAEKESYIEPLKYAVGGFHEGQMDVGGHPAEAAEGPGGDREGQPSSPSTRSTTRSGISGRSSVCCRSARNSASTSSTPSRRASTCRFSAGRSRTRTRSRSSTPATTTSGS